MRCGNRRGESLRSSRHHPTRRRPRLRRGRLVVLGRNRLRRLHQGYRVRFFGRRRAVSGDERHLLRLRLSDRLAGGLDGRLAARFTPQTPRRPSARLAPRDAGPRPGPAPQSGFRRLARRRTLTRSRLSARGFCRRPGGPRSRVGFRHTAEDGTCLPATMSTLLLL